MFEFAIVTPAAYGMGVGIAAIFCAILCTSARQHPGRWVAIACDLLGLALALDAASWLVAEARAGTFSAKTSLPFALCNMAIAIGAIACVRRDRVLVELTYFVGLAGTLQAVITPDLSAGFPHLVFFQYLVGHCGIVVAALLLVVGVGITPGKGAPLRCFGICVAYSALVGAIDAAFGANYMFLRRPPGNWTLLRLLGPWPWYIVSASAVALVLFVLLDLPFAKSRTDSERAIRTDAPPDRMAQGSVVVWDDKGQPLRKD